MYIEKSITIDDHVVLVHQIARIEINGEVAMVTISSSAALEGSPQVFPHLVSIPLGDLNGSIKAQVYAWLILPGHYLEGGTVVSEQIALGRFKYHRTVEISTMRDVKIHEGCRTPFGIVDSDEISIRNVLGSCQIASILTSQSIPFSMNWRLQNNELISVSAADIIQIGLAVMKHVSGCYEVSWALKAAVLAATTRDAIDTMDIDSPFSTLDTSISYVAPQA